MEHTGDVKLEPGAEEGRVRTCVWCDGTALVRYHLPHLWHERAGAPSFDIRWCDGCDSGFLDPQPSPEDRARFARQARELERDWPALIPAHATLMEKVRVRIAWQVSHSGVRLKTSWIEELAAGRALRICVFGSNDNDMLRRLEQSGHDVVVVDCGLDARADPSFRDAAFHQGSIEAPALALPAGSFDLVVASSVLQNCSDPGEALKNVHRVLKPSGILLAEVPNNEAYSARRLGPAWFHCDAGRACHFFTSRSLSRIAETHGFRIVDRLFNVYTGQFRNPRLVIEQKLWDHLYSDVAKQAVRPPLRKSQKELWRSLLASMFLPPTRKYEVIGVIAKKSDE
jgi:SAM-dependent methyltransferase